MLHFKPRVGCFGDPMPFYWDGQYHLFHIVSPEPGSAQGHYLGHAVSSDLLHWEELPPPVTPGGPCSPDEHLCGTGCVIEKDGKFYLFYLGRRHTEYNQRRETMCLSTSDDLIHWTKYKSNPVSVPEPTLYEWGAWRDGAVFWNEQAGCYWMVITACLRKGPSNRRGCLALATSKDLLNWTVEEKPFWQPNLTGRPLECPQVFQWNDWWYLIFFPDCATRYRMAKQIAGPWIKPENDSFGGDYIKAGKVVSDGNHWWLLAFLSQHTGGTDGGVPNDRYDMALPRKLAQNPDGTLRVVGPSDIDSKLNDPIQLRFREILGDWRQTGNELTGSRADGLGYAVADVSTRCCVIDLIIRSVNGCGHVGIAVRTEDDLRPGYVLWLMPDRNELQYTRLPGWYGYPPYERQPLQWNTSQPIKVKIIVDETAFEAFVGGQVSIAGRMCDKKEGKLALLVQEGSAVFESISVRPLIE